MRALFAFCLIVISYSSFSQLNYHYSNPDKNFEKAREYFFNKELALAYPLLNYLHTYYQTNSNDLISIKEDVNYYFLVTALLLNKGNVLKEAENFLSDKNNQERNSSMAFYVGHYFFKMQQYDEAIKYYNKSGLNNLGNEEIADLKFELAYSYFFRKDYEKSKPLFNEIHQLKSNKYYLPANYYFGFISYREKDYENALNSFKLVENLPEYSGLVPYYIAEIYYFQNKKIEALEYANKGLLAPDFYYRKELQLLAGQIYFENKDFKKSLPLFESYISGQGKVSKQLLYELSYDYYEANENDKAIEGFKQLSGEKDSLGQNSMYLLGGLYLRLNDKANARTAFQFSGNNSSNLLQQEVSSFNYSKLSYELKFSDVALKEIKRFLEAYPKSKYQSEAKEILVDLLSNAHNFKDALVYYNTISNPSATLRNLLPKLWYGRALELLSDGRGEEAADLLKKIVNDGGNTTVVSLSNFWLSELGYRNLKFDDAITFGNRYLALPVTDGEATVVTANYIIGYSYLKKQDFNKSLQYFSKISPKINGTSTPLEQDAYLRAADSYYMLKNYPIAKGMYENVIANSLAGSDYALYQIAEIVGINNNDEKIKNLITLENKYPTSELIADADLGIANSYMANEKFKDAIPYLEKINKGRDVKYKPRALLKLGLAWYNLNDNNNALSYYQQLLEKYPRSEESDLALQNIKSIYVNKGVPEEYFSLLKKAGKTITSSEEDSLSFSAAQVQYINGNCNLAIPSFTNYINRFPTGFFLIQSYYERSECYYKNKDWTTAASGYEIVANSTSKLTEKATLQLARLYYLELRDYSKARIYFEKLNAISTIPENKLEGLRGLVRSLYQTKDFNAASNVTKDLLAQKNISTDDKAIGNLVLGKSLEDAKKYEEAIIAFKVVTILNKLVWGAEARYEIANCYFNLNNLPLAEKEAMEVIKINGSSDFWITKSYLLLGDIYMLEKDYFNAKATFQSVADNSLVPEIKTEAQQKLATAISTEKLNSKIAP